MDGRRFRDRRDPAGKLAAFSDMLALDQKAWTAHVQLRNYDQAWSMVHFLVHGRRGRYRQAFLGFLRDVSRGRAARPAFEGRFGRNYPAFQQRYAEWWLALGEEPTAGLYTQATVAALTSYLARGHVQGLRFGGAREFLAAARAGKIQTAAAGPAGLYLPPGLLKTHLARAAELKAWSLRPGPGLPALKLSQPDGTTFVGAFALGADGRPAVTVTVTPTD